MGYLVLPTISRFTVLKWLGDICLEPLVKITPNDYSNTICCSLWWLWWGLWNWIEPYWGTTHRSLASNLLRCFTPWWTTNLVCPSYLRWSPQQRKHSSQWTMAICGRKPKWLLSAVTCGLVCTSICQKAGEIWCLWNCKESFRPTNVAVRPDIANNKNQPGFIMF